MFEKITKKFTKKIIESTKETVKEELEPTVDKHIQALLTIVTIGITIFSFVETKSVKTESVSTTINNYYYYNR
jgi:DNA-binding transcriptional regulator YbjK